MEGKFAMFVVICVGLITTEAFPNQTPTGKNVHCPHGKCFIDRCMRICSCDQEAQSCIRLKRHSLVGMMQQCDAAAVEGGNCPYGQIFSSEMWSVNFVCTCNNDSSQTYECIDKTTQNPADFHVMAKSVEAHYQKLSLSKQTRSTL